MTDAVIPTKPYLLRALYEWCTDNGFTPYIAVQVDGSVHVPMEHVRNGEIVLNISFDATNGLRIDNDAVHFKARFGGIARDIYIPVERVAAIYARENGQGMAFPVEPVGATASGAETAPAGHPRAPATTNRDNASVVTPLRPVSGGSAPAQPGAGDQPAPPSPSEDQPPPPPGTGGPSRLTRVK